jgi:hypothetical protein
MHGNLRICTGSGGKRQRRDRGGERMAVIKATSK